MKNILLIDICNEKLGFYEFVKPIKDILIKNNFKVIIRHYTKLRKRDLEKIGKVIICGTALYDDKFIENIDKFRWLIDLDRSVLGICGGMQIVGMVFGGTLCRGTEIGYYNEKFDNDFLGLTGNQEVYHLHNNYVDFSNLDFEIFAGNKINQGVKHKKKRIYGVLFHPEVRQKDLILNFCNSR